ncbi:class I SAM-dependent methyltransferase [Mesobacillus foraminis]|uniref:Methyltransferase family protein n=1 Tax=Mesobacillus foraminis TaxID=279826 RepID=A0A4V2RCD8_9BACI|nr:class I SAM-dependent methyltransferase [Mesobacillus foraminis]TCN20520.1 methyltransferase family protein [Mesobacillus foraminis]
MDINVRTAFDQLASDYEHHADTKNAYNIYYERPAMLNLFPANIKNQKVLDAGCAAGWYTAELLKLGAEVTATDISTDMVAAAKRRVGNKARVLNLDLSKELPFQNHSFDLIISSLVMHYIQDWDRPFSEFQRILKPGGILLFSTHHPFMDINLSKEKKYFSTELINDQWERQGKLIDVPFYRRPLNEILNKTLQYFTIESIVEPQPTVEFKSLKPDGYERLMNNPNFLIVKARRGN